MPKFEMSIEQKLIRELIVHINFLRLQLGLAHGDMTEEEFDGEWKRLYSTPHHKDDGEAELKNYNTEELKKMMLLLEPVLKNLDIEEIDTFDFGSLSILLNIPTDIAFLLWKELKFENFYREDHIEKTESSEES